MSENDSVLPFSVSDLGDLVSASGYRRPSVQFAGVALRKHFSVMRRILLTLGVAGAMGCAGRVNPSTAPQSNSYDVVIENGKIVDGTGNVWFYGDVGITGDRITRVAPIGTLTNS